jgi:ElaB/YqjD/DUF883 family membrane-anchored ribosome-binding protein
MNTEMTSTKEDVTKEKLMQDLSVVVADAEELLRATATHASEKMPAIRARIQENLAVAKERLAEAQNKAIEKTRAAAKATDEYVHENPWKSVGIAAGAGLIIGMLISRGR